MNNNSLYFIKSNKLLKNKKKIVKKNRIKNKNNFISL